MISNKIKLIEPKKTYELLETVAQRDFKKFKQLVEEKKVDLTVTNREKRNCLHLACYSGFIEFIIYLLAKEEGCKNLLNQVDDEEETPFLLFARKTYEGKVNTEHSKSVLPATVTQGMMVTLLKYFIKNGLDIHVVNKKKHNVLHYLCLLDYKDVVTILFSESKFTSPSKSDFTNATNLLGKTPLHLAIENDFFELVSLLLKHGCKINMIDTCGHTPLHAASVYTVSRKIFNLLLSQSGIEINFQDKWGQTPLHIAVGSSADDKVEKLMAAKADPSIKDDAGYTPFQFAVSEDQPKIVEFFLKNTEQTTDELEVALFFAVKTGFFETTELLCQCYCQKPDLFKSFHLELLLKESDVLIENPQYKDIQECLKKWLNAIKKPNKKNPFLFAPPSPLDYSTIFLPLFQGIIKKVKESPEKLGIFELEYLWWRFEKLYQTYSGLNQSQKKYLQKHPDVEKIMGYCKGIMGLGNNLDAVELKFTVLQTLYFSLVEIKKFFPLENVRVKLKR